MESHNSLIALTILLGLWLSCPGAIAAATQTNADPTLYTASAVPSGPADLQTALNPQAALNLHAALDPRTVSDPQNNTEPESSAVAQSAASNQIAADPQTDANPTPSAPSPKSSGLTSKELLAPIRFLELYVSNGYQPFIEFDKQGQTNFTQRNARGYSFYIAGPIGKHFSTYTQGNPLDLDHGFWTKWTNTDLRSNWGDSQQFVMLRGGLQFDLFEGGGLGLADRTATNTTPFIYAPNNGYDPTAASRGLSLEYTLPGWTTAKTFMYFNQPVLSGDPTIEVQRSRGMGVIFEKLLDKTTTSSLQFQSVFGYTPTVLQNIVQIPIPGTDPNNPVTKSLTESAQSLPVRFQRYNFLANKAFNDANGHERLNAMFGLMLDHERNLIGLNNNQTHTVGYGYTFELLTIPIVRHLALLCRYNQLRPNNHQLDNTLYAFDVGVVLDVAGPAHPRHWERWHGKMTFDYQITCQHGAPPAHQWNIGWWTIM